MRAKAARSSGVALTALLLAALLAPAAQAKVRRKVPRRLARGSVSSVAGTQAMIKAGLESLEAKDFSAAINSFTRACRSEGGSAAYFLLGYAHYQRGFLSGDTDNADKQDALEATNAFTTALALDPALSRLSQPYKLYHSLALSYEALGSYDKAAEAYKAAMTVSPRNPLLPLYAARLRYHMTDTVKSLANLTLSLERAKAARQLHAVVSMLQSDPRFSMMLANPAHLEIVRRYDATVEAPATAPAPAAPPAQDGQMLAMRDSVRDSGSADPRHAALQELDKSVLDVVAAANDEFKFRRYRKAVDLYREALDLNERSGILNPLQIAVIHESIGTAYNKLGLTADAIQTLKQSLQGAPVNAGAHYQLALSYSVSGRFNDALQSLKDAWRNASSAGELRRYMLLAKTDAELEPVRDLPAFVSSLEAYRQRAISLQN